MKARALSWWGGGVHGAISFLARAFQMGRGGAPYEVNPVPHCALCMSERKRSAQLSVWCVRRTLHKPGVQTNPDPLAPESKTDAQVQ